MNSVLCKNLKCNSFNIFRLLARNITTHYDILHLQRNCSNKDIREAYLKLSKICHPDVQGAAKSRTDFLKITEAYQTLSKPDLRLRYDQDLLSRERMNFSDNGGQETYAQYHRPWEVKPDLEHSPGPYYGVKGLRKVSNSRIVFLLVGLTIFGAFFGFLSANVAHYFSSSFQTNRKKLDERTVEAESHYAAVRADAQKYTNEEQIKRVLDRLAKS